jgi:hypothetical protein
MFISHFFSAVLCCEVSHHIYVLVIEWLPGDVGRNGNLFGIPGLKDVSCNTFFLFLAGFKIQNGR